VNLIGTHRALINIYYPTSNANVTKIVKIPAIWIQKNFERNAAVAINIILIMYLNLSNWDIMGQDQKLIINLNWN